MSLSQLQIRMDNAQHMDITSREPGTVRGTTKRPHFSLAIISVTVQLWTQVFWVISVYFNIRNTLPKFCPFLLVHPVYIKKKQHISYITLIELYYYRSHQISHQDIFTTSTELPSTYNSHNPQYCIQILFHMSLLFMLFSILIYYINY